MRTWPHLRAAIVAFHVLALVLVNIPAPTGSPLALTGHDASAAEEVATWSHVLHLSPDELVGRLLVVRERWLSTRARGLAPFLAYQRLAGAEQPWSMFSSPNRMPPSLVLELWTDREWKLIGGLPLGEWRPWMFGSERTRSFTNATAREAAHDELDLLCEALGRRALADHPGATQARCRVVLRRSPTLAGDAPADETTLHVLVVGGRR